MRVYGIKKGRSSLENGVFFIMGHYPFKSEEWMTPSQSIKFLDSLKKAIRRVK